MTNSRTLTDDASVTPLQQRGIEIGVAQAFLAVLEDRLGKIVATEVFQQAVERLAISAAESFRDRYPTAKLADLWEVWELLGGEGRLDLHLDELAEHRLRFHVDRCAYAELYRSRGMEEIGIAFSCRRDAPFAEALVPGVIVAQSATILEGSSRCEFTYTLEDR